MKQVRISWIEVSSYLLRYVARSKDLDFQFDHKKLYIKEKTICPLYTLLKYNCVDILYVSASLWGLSIYCKYKSALQTIFDLFIPRKDLAKPHSQIN